MPGRRSPAAGPTPARSTRGRTAPGLVLSALLAVPVAACGGDPTSPAAAPPRASAESAVTALPALPPPNGRPLPPTDVVAVADLYGPALAAQGLRLTRAGLYDRSDGGYEASDTGTHLALYVEPVAALDADGYADRLWTSAALLTPDVFARWPGLETYDVCLEPLPAEDASEEPPPVTQLDISRQAAAGVDWGGGLADLLAATGFQLNVRSDVRSSATYTAAEAEARRRQASGRTASPGSTASTASGGPAAPGAPGPTDDAPAPTRRGYG